MATATLLYGWGFIAAKTLGPGDSAYRLRAMYVEFENVAAPEDLVVTPGEVPRDEGVAYYNGLADSPSRDFLRIPLVQDPTIDVEDGFAGFFSAGQGNRLTFFAMTSGETGVHGKPFSAAANSKICGTALVAAPDWNDRTRDVVAVRSYFSSDEQPLKPASQQIALTQQMPFI